MYRYNCCRVLYTETRLKTPFLQSCIPVNGITINTTVQINVQDVILSSHQNIRFYRGILGKRQPPT